MIECAAMLADISGVPPSWFLLMLSAPTATPTSLDPAMIWFTMLWTANRPDEQSRLAIEAAAVTGKPAARAAERAT